MIETVFEKNIQSLKNRDLQFAEALLKYCSAKDMNQTEQNLDKVYPGSEKIDGREILYVRKGENFFQLDSLYNSHEVLNIWSKQLHAPNFNTKLIMFGLGNAMYIRAFLKKVPFSERIVVYEPSVQIFSYVIETFDLQDIIEDQRILIYVDGINGYPHKESLYRYFNYQDIENLLFLDYINYTSLFPKQYQDFHTEVQKMVNTINAMDYVWERFGVAYYNNTLLNFPYMLNSYSLSELCNQIPDGVPAILVSAGPSLDKNINQLKNVNGRALIIAVDSALKALINKNIIPDLFITVDGKKMEAHFQDERIKEIPMVCNLVSNTNVVMEHKGKHFFIDDMNEHIEKVLKVHGKALPIVESGGSVANSAYSLLELMGFKTIIMIGQDLAYTDNKTHASDTIRGSWNMDITELKLIEVEGYFGDIVKSSDEFGIYLEWFENEIRRRKDVTMINATQGGAKIHGAVEMSLDDAIKTYCKKEVDIQKIMKQTGKWLTDEERTEIAKEFRNILNEVRLIKKHAKNAIYTYRKMLEQIYQGKYKTKEFIAMFKKTKVLAETIEGTDALYYVDCMMQEQMNEITSDVYVLKEDEKSELIEGVTKGLNYMEAIVKTTDLILPDMEQKIEEGMKKIE